MCVSVRVCARVCTCVRACVCARVNECVHVLLRVSLGGLLHRRACEFKGYIWNSKRST